HAATALTTVVARTAATAADSGRIPLEPQRFPRLIGVSLPMQRLRTQLERVCGSRADVLLRAETGTGKELVAKTIHEDGKRGKGPFVAINVAEVSDNLLEP